MIMRNIFIVMFMLVASVAFGQKTFAPDTLTNTDTAIYQLQTGNWTTNSTYAFYIKTTEISGSPTIAVSVQHRVGAGDWVVVSSDTIATSGTPNSAAIIKTAVDSPASNYRVVVYATGTGVSKIDAILTARKK